MLLLLTASLCIASISANYDDFDESYIFLDNTSDELAWADNYFVKATRISILSNIVEDFSAWKSNQSSRIDYNQGAVKSITLLRDGSDSTPVKLEIHPQTTEEELNTIVCHYTNITYPRKYLRLDEILPSLEDDYEPVGNETYKNGIYVTRFEYTEEQRKSFTKHVILASFDDELGWVPREYEQTVYNSILGSLITHDIWTFFDYRPDTVDEEVFSTEDYDCTEAYHEDDSEGVIKELLFINPENNDHVEHVFHHFKNKFNRKYIHEQEHILRKSIFKENMRLITSVNRRNLSYKLGVNQFADWTPEEKQKTLGVLHHPHGLQGAKPGTVPFPYDEKKISEEVDKLPKEYDMRELGLISAVKNQDMCGSCWTFAASAVVESALARVNGGTVLSLSNQAIIDCAYEGLTAKDGGGCDGGYDFAAYNFIMKHGLPTDLEYGPYKMRDGFCNIGNMTKTYTIQGYTSVTKYSANAMKVAVVNNGPLYIYIQVTYEFFLYSRGIFYKTEEECGTEDPNHAVILVGYGEEDGEPFWILKNSYGENWGEDGYMRISARDNVCGVASNPTYPVF